MQRAKAFLFVCTGLFLLALSYELGARSARAQAGGSIEGAAFAWVQGLPAAWRCSGVQGRIFYSLDGNGGTTVASDPIPGTAHVIATDAAGFSVMLDNGDVLMYSNPGWRRIGNLLGGGPVSAQQPTFGQLKAQYRK